MSAIELRQTFRRKFRSVTRQIWSLQVGRGIALTVLLTAAVFGALAAADYLFELPWATRAVLSGASAVSILALATVWIIRPARSWNRVRVASELEGLFPRLGQRLRTASQHGERSVDDLTREGVAPGLVAALEEETAEKVKPLPLQAALPIRPAFIAISLAMICVTGLVVAAMWLPELQTAFLRVGLTPTTYTKLSATASSNVVDEGTNVDIRAAMEGRARPEVVLNIREVGETEWRQETMDKVDDNYTSRLANLRVSTEFFVTAGPE